jgi:hypothetical protein
MTYTDCNHGLLEAAVKKHKIFQIESFAVSLGVLVKLLRLKRIHSMTKLCCP